MSNLCDCSADEKTRHRLHDLYECGAYKVRPRIYIQFNELVFDGVATVETADLSGDNKISTTPYPFKHGDYYDASFNHGRILMGAQDLALDLTLPFIFLNRNQVMDYHAFIQFNLSRAGKIWAVDAGGKLIWAYAIPKHPPYTDYEVSTGKTLHMSMDFLLPEGVWHVADTNNIFFFPYDMCDFKECIESKCAHDCNDLRQCTDIECGICNPVTEEMNYCNTVWNPYDPCHNEYQIIYNCSLAKKYFGYETLGLHFIQENCIFTGKFCSNGIYDSPVVVTLVGKYKNPSVKINDTRIGVKGCFDGEIQFCTDGSVHYTAYEDCDNKYRCSCRLPYEDIIYETNDVTFYAAYGNNQFVITNEEENPVFNQAFFLIDEWTI